jgi:hypothetical protein
MQDTRGKVFVDSTNTRKQFLKNNDKISETGVGICIIHNNYWS